MTLSLMLNIALRRPSKGPCSQALSESLDIQEQDQEASGCQGSCPALARRTKCSYSWWGGWGWDVLKSEDFLTLTLIMCPPGTDPRYQKMLWVLVDSLWLVKTLQLGLWLADRWPRCILSWAIIRVKTPILSCIIFSVLNRCADCYNRKQ